MNRRIYKLLFFCMVSMLSVFVHAASLQVTYRINDATETVTSGVSTEGHLVDLLEGEANAMKVTQLSVKGCLNDADIKLLQKMAGQTKGTGQVPQNHSTIELQKMAGRTEVTGSLKSLNLSEATFTETGKIVPESIFQNCKNLQHVDLSNMTEIGKGAFENCALTDISIPASVTKICAHAFRCCSALKTLEFVAGTPEKELVLETEAFFGCGNMDLANKGVLPSRIISIAARTFQECGITKLTLPQNDKLTGVSRKLEFNGVQTDNMGALGYGVFFGCRKLTDLTIPANVTVINEVVFQDCNLQNVIFDDATKITEIQKNAFTNNQNLTGLFAGKHFDNLKTIGEGAFLNCFKLTDADFYNLTKNITRIERETFRNCHEGLKTIDLRPTIEFIGDGAFADNPNVTNVIVHRGTQINAQTYAGNAGIFYGMDPNKVQVEFQGEAETNYQVYRDNINVGGEEKGKNAFMFLLTKTLDENANDYQVVAQHHADICLKRTFKAGWNTLVLPFGARDIEGKTVKCARIYQKALNASGDEGFMIAAYRGLAKNEAQPDNSTFYFLQYANYDTDPLDEFEPLLVRMTQKDIDNASGVYTFKDIELNYDAGNNTSYTAEQAKQRMGKNEKDEYFTGNYDQKLNDKFKKCSYDNFYFTGTLHLQQGNATEGSAFIAPGDYIIQDNTFVKCLAGKKYGLKGFRGYFKQLPSSTSPAKGNIGICLVDRNGVVSSIHQVDGASLTSASVAPAAVYNLSGQQVGNSLSTLAKGVYIVKGKKFVKK
nr:leucine-rich repeat domain-containing protein [Prevotella sp.]